MRLQKCLALVEELHQRRLAFEADAAHHVVNVVAIQPAGGREQDVVVLADFELVPFENVGPGLVVLLDRNEFEVVVIEIEHAGRRAVGERNRHPAFARREAVVADRRRRRTAPAAATDKR